MCRTRSRSRVARSAIACDAEAAGRSALDGDLGRLKTGAPGEWPIPRGSAPGGRNGGQPVTGRVRSRARAAARRAPQVLRRSCQSGRGEYPEALAPAPPSEPSVTSPARARLPRAGSRARRRGALRAPLKYVKKVVTTSDNTRCRRLSAEVSAGHAVDTMRWQPAGPRQHMFTSST